MDSPEWFSVTPISRFGPCVRLRDYLGDSMSMCTSTGYWIDVRNLVPLCVQTLRHCRWLKMYCGGPNNIIISFLTKSITQGELNKAAGITLATGHFYICLTATTRYWFPSFVRSSGPAKSMHLVWNNPLIGILRTDSFFGSLVLFSDRYHSHSRSLPLLVAY